MTPQEDEWAGSRRSSYYAPGTAPTPVQQPASRLPLPLEYDASPVPATRPVPIQPMPQARVPEPARQEAPRRPQAQPQRSRQQRPQAQAQAQAQRPQVQPQRPRQQFRPQPQAPRTMPVQRQVVRTGAEPLTITRPLPVQRPTEIARVAPSVRRTPRSARRAVRKVLRAPVTGPTPIVAAAPAKPQRHGARAMLAMLGVFGLTAVTGLPAVAQELTEAPPPTTVDGEVQEFEAGAYQEQSSAADIAAWGTISAPNWIDPAIGHLTDGFGPRLNRPVAGVNLFHRGQDVAAPCGTPIHVAADGVVSTATYWGTYGNWVLVDHGNGVATGYAHQSRMIVSPGQHVEAGQTIGYVGNTGASTGCHLHLEVHINGVAINPVPFFTAKGVTLGS